MSRVLVTICARGGSKGLPGKHLRPLAGKAVITHTFECALLWARAAQDREVVLSTDSAEIIQVAEGLGVKVPFVRPAELSGDSIGKLPVLTHALLESEKKYACTYDTLLDLDPTAPLRSVADIDGAWKVFQQGGHEVVFSVVRARKNPYFNMVERDEDGAIRLCKKRDAFFMSRQQSPKVWELNASIYIYRADFLRKGPDSLWRGKTEIFEMPVYTAFDIDEERDLVLVEALMKWRATQ